jgi:hypothetical protein
MAMITRSDIEQLLAMPSTPGMMLSCYVDLSARTGPVRHFLGMIKHDASLIRADISDNFEQSKEFEVNFRAVMRILEYPEFQGTPGLAVFAAKQRRQFHVLPLNTSVLSELVYSHEPYLVPLLQAYFASQREFLALAFDNKTCYLFRIDAAGMRPATEWTSSVPKKHHASGERGGWSQATMAHHRETLLSQFHQAIAERLIELHRARPYADVILLGHRSAVNQLRNHLPESLRKRICVTHACEDLHARPVVEKTISKIVKEQRARLPQLLLSALRHRQQEKSGFALGAKDVLAAIDGGKLTPKDYLLLGADPRETVQKCSSCRYLTLDDHDICPRCGSACKSANLWEELLLRALRHDWRVVCFDSAGFLSEEESVAIVF